MRSAGFPGVKMREIKPGEEAQVQELISRGLAKGGQVLSTMLNTSIELKDPALQLVDLSELKARLQQDYPETLAGVRMGYLGTLNGEVELILTTDDATRLAEVITDGLYAGDDLDALRSATISEIGNVVINAIIGTISNRLSLNLKFTVPQYMEGQLNEMLKRIESVDSSMVILAKTAFLIQELDIQGHILLLFSLNEFDAFRRALAEAGEA